MSIISEGRLLIKPGQEIPETSVGRDCRSVNRKPAMGRASCHCLVMSEAHHTIKRDKLNLLHRHLRAEHHAVCDLNEAPPSYALDPLRIAQLGEGQPAWRGRRA